MSTDTATRHPKGIPAGGQFAATAHPEAPVALTPTTADISCFPHPDKNYPHPIECWPEGVDLPTTITLGEVDETLPEANPRWLHPDPQNERSISQPSCTITMSNGASLTLTQVGDPEGGNFEERFTGDWEHYLNGDGYARDCVLEVASETMTQADKA